jgi:hypothetical protein
MGRAASESRFRGDGRAPKSKIAEGQRLHYNFVRPHMALEGQMPAQSAGVGIEGKDEWMELIGKSLKAGPNP